MKTCKECKKELPLTEFAIRKPINYVEAACKKCQRKRSYNTNDAANKAHKERQNILRQSCGEKVCSTCKEKKPFSHFAKNRQCRECYNSYMREWCSKNRKKVNERNKKHRYENKELYRGKALKSLFGITLDEYNEMLNRQNGACKICLHPETAKHKSGKIKNLAVDHCHSTGKVRGLLCARCNTVLGTVNDNIERLKYMIKYLEESIVNRGLSCKS